VIEGLEDGEQTDSTALRVARLVPLSLSVTPVFHTRPDVHVGRNRREAIVADRQVTNAHRNDQGDILAVCWKGSDGLKYSARAAVIAHIEAGTHQYFVAEQAPSVWVLVRTRSGVKYITTEADSTSRNNLDNLPACTKA
jgi:hypothetical protein